MGEQVQEVGKNRIRRLGITGPGAGGEHNQEVGENRIRRLVRTGPGGWIE